jgi:Tfp pilus assembly protein PilN
MARLINLLPESEQRELHLQMVAQQVSSFWIWVVVSLLIFGGFSYFGQFTINDQIAQTDRTINVRSAVLNSGENEKYKNEVETLNANIKSIEVLSKEQYQWSRVLQEIAVMLPADIVLDSLIMRRDTGKIDLIATAGERASILKFWSAVVKSEYFTNINFPLSNLEKSTDAPFTFTFYLKSGKLNSPSLTK